MGKIYTIGEALIDWIPQEAKGSLADVDCFEKRPGGAPANVAVAAAKLGAESYFIGMVGDDPFGHFMMDTMKGYGVHMDYIFQTKEAKTALAFVTLGENGQRDFSFYRNPSADLLLTEKEIEHVHLTAEDYISFCSVDLVDYPVKKATEKLLQNAKACGTTVLFDPNVRKDLWDDLQECKETILYFMRYADIVKLADDEVEFITGKKTIAEGMEYLKELGVTNFLVTLGPDGSDAYFGEKKAHGDGCKVTAVDTTGAGDSFVGSFLYQLCAKKKTPANIREDELSEILGFCNKVASIVTTKKGAMNAIPTKEELDKLL